jgi:hypothetical protein
MRRKSSADFPQAVVRVQRQGVAKVRPAPAGEWLSHNEFEMRKSQHTQVCVCCAIEQHAFVQSKTGGPHTNAAARIDDVKEQRQDRVAYSLKVLWVRVEKGAALIGGRRGRNGLCVRD